MTATTDQVKEKAAEMELAAADFLTKKGKISGDQRKWKILRLTFVDGTVMMVPRKVAETPEFDSIEFSLRPARQQ